MYVVFRLGGGALWVQWLYIVVAFVSVLILRPVLLHNEVNFTYQEVFRCTWDCFKPIIFAGALAFGSSYFFGDTLFQQATLFVVVLIETCAVVWLFLEKPMRKYIVEMVKSKLRR